MLSGLECSNGPIRCPRLGRERGRGGRELLLVGDNG